MSKGLTAEERKARRAEINRENAKKSTGPTSQAGKMIVRLNGLKHGARSSVIDLSGFESLVLLPNEGPKEYQRVVANFSDKIQPRDEVELGLSQRLADLHWRLMRLTRNERIFNEECLQQACQMAHVGVSDERLGDLDSMSAYRVAAQSQVPRDFRRDEAAILRAIAATYRELVLLRKLDPLPKTPLTRRAQVIAPSLSPTAMEIQKPVPDQKIQPADLIEETAEAPDNQSQPLVGWTFPVIRVPQPEIAVAAGIPLDFS